MTIESVLSSLTASLSSVSKAFTGDVAKVMKSLDASNATIDKTTNTLDLWSSGANIASITIENAEVPSFVPESVQPSVVAKKAVSFDRPAAPAALHTPMTASKVKSMLSVWEDKIQRTPFVKEEPTLKRKEMTSDEPKQKELEPILEIPDLDSSMFADDEGDILEIPEDYISELQALEPSKRVARLSLLVGEEAAVDIINESFTKAPESVAPFLTGKVAAALKLFTGTRVLKEFQAPPSSVKYTKPSGPTVGFQRAEPVPEEDPGLDGAPFYDATNEQEEEMDEEDPANHSVLHAQQAAALVAEEEAAQNELDKSAWLADIEEIRVVATPAKVSDESTTRVHDWSVVSQKMNLSCTLTPVVPGRRSCITVEPIMIQLGPKHDEDQYEVTDKDTESETELSPNTRAKKHIPPWCVNWRQKAIAQIAVDPESIFGITMPRCDLDIIFDDRNYARMGLQRPKRVRGSSGNWTFDKLTQNEIDMYRAKCGQVVKAEGVFIE